MGSAGGTLLRGLKRRFGGLPVGKVEVGDDPKFLTKR